MSSPDISTERRRHESVLSPCTNPLRIIAVGSGEAVLKYLAPYLFRVAVSNRNILALKDGRVTFRYRDAKTGATVPAEQFIRRFLYHVLPRSFQKVRAYGLLHPKQRALLACVKELLHQGSLVTVEPVPHSARLIPGRPTAFLCPSCACEMIHICQILRKRGPP
jgi:hypothetical protein